MASPRKHTPRLKRGDPVWWHYRSAIGHGYIEGVATIGTNEATTRYRVRQVDQHISRTGAHEHRIVIHTGAALHRSSRQAVEAAARAARQR